MLPSTQTECPLFRQGTPLAGTRLRGIFLITEGLNGTIPGIKDVNFIHGILNLRVPCFAVRICFVVHGVYYTIPNRL